MGDWEVLIEDGSLPPIFSSYVEHAEFIDQVGLDEVEGRILFLGISHQPSTAGWPSVVIALKYPDARQTFRPGILLLPDPSLVFIGAGERLLCYDIKQKIRLWEDRTDCGFWGWQQSGPYVLMSAELEFGVWGQSGEKLWTTFVEPPWGFEVKGAIVELDVMGQRRVYQLSDGIEVGR